MTDTNPYDCLIIGGGPAGLTAAIYLSRFLLDIRVVDAGNSRAGWIPCSRNHAGYPDGINGNELLQLMRDQAQKYGAKIDSARVSRLELGEDGMFSADWGQGSRRARSVLLATGVTNRRPPMDPDLHDDAMAAGLIRYCPICDGFEVTDKKVGVIGSGESGVAEAMFLRSYTANITLIAPDGTLDLTNEEKGRLAAARVRCVDGPAEVMGVTGKSITVDSAEGLLTFDSIYPALGTDTHTQLGKMVGATLAEDGCFLCDEKMRTSVPGLYAAGDVVHGLDQISHAMGEGGQAATTIRNDLADASPILREPVMTETQVETVETDS